MLLSYFPIKLTDPLVKKRTKMFSTPIINSITFGSIPNKAGSMIDVIASAIVRTFSQIVLLCQHGLSGMVGYIGVAIVVVIVNLLV